MFTYSRILVDESALRANYRSLQSEAKSAICIPVIKADAYGIGAPAVAKILYQDGCRSFFLAFTDEADQLKPILANDVTFYILAGPYLSGWEAYYHNRGYIPVINSFDSLETWNRYAQKCDRKLKAVLHIDTGMNRLGLSVSAFRNFSHNRFPHIDIVFVMSHLISSEDPHAASNQSQLTGMKQLQTHFPEMPLSLANSSGIYLGKAYHFAVVRPGGALYGINPTPYQNNPLTPVVRIAARILQISHLKKGETIGYNSTFTCDKDRCIATVAIGYADGIPWQLSNKRVCVKLKEHWAPIVGRISMDLITIDITDLPMPNVGAWVELVNTEQPLETFAHLTNNHPYQLLLNLGKRAQKVYTDAISGP